LLKRNWQVAKGIGQLLGCATVFVASAIKEKADRFLPC
jgi:hypothetical protein